MMKKLTILVLTIGFVLGIVYNSFAMCGWCGAGPHKAEAKEKTVQSKTAEKVNNTICPVSGDAVDMKNAVTYEYKGKIYNLCCSACIADFKKDPDKYIKIVEKEKAKETGDTHSH